MAKHDKVRQNTAKMIKEKVLLDGVSKETMRYILATRELLESRSEDSFRPYILLQNYTNFLRIKEAQEKMKPFATIVPATKYMLARFFTLMLQEMIQITPVNVGSISLVTLSSDERTLIESQYSREADRNRAMHATIENKRMALVTEHATEANVLCATEFMWKVISRSEITPNSALEAAKDPTGYFGEKVRQLLPTSHRDEIFVLTITMLFERFLKCISHDICCMIWENHTTVNAKLLNGILRIHHISEDLKQELVHAIVKPQRRPKKSNPTTPQTGGAQSADPVVVTKNTDNGGVKGTGDDA